MNNIDPISWVSLKYDLVPVIPDAPTTCDHCLFEERVG
jgi:hypothetical protein